MKRTLVVSLCILGLARIGLGATGNIFWAPADANWNTTTPNWYSTNLSANVSFTDGASVIFDNSGAAQPAVTLVGTLSPASVVVDAPIDYTFTSTTGGMLTNVASVTKAGVGKLTLDSDNAITGPLDLQAGTLQIGAGAGRGAVGTGRITNSSTLVINRTSTLNLSNDISGPGTLSIPATGTVNIRGNNTMTGPINHNGAILNFLGASTIGTPSAIAIGTLSNTRFQISGGVTLSSGCPISFTGATGSTVRNALQGMDGINTVNGPISVGQGGAGGIVQLMAMNAGTELNVYSSVADKDPTPYNGNFYLRGTSGLGRMYGTINLPAANLIKTDANGSWTIYSTGNNVAAILVAQGLLRLAIDNALPNKDLTIGQSGATATLDLGGFNQQVNSLNDVAGGTAIVGNSSTTSNSVLTISAGGVYGGAIQDSLSGGTRKVGIRLLSGAQQLSANCTYSGPTTISGGGISLVGAGSIPNTTPIQFANGSALDTRYKSDSTLTLQPSQTLKGDGTFHISGSLASQGTIELKLNKSNGVVTGDGISLDDLAYVLTYGGTLKLDLSGEAFTAADNYQCFSAGNYAGAFDNIVPATPGPGFLWNTNTLNSDGILRIAIGPLPTTPTNITCTVVGGTQLKLEWPPGYTGWVLQGQTNAPGVGITTAWHDVPDSSTTNQVYFPVSQANGSVFFRMVYRP